VIYAIFGCIGVDFTIEKQINNNRPGHPDRALLSEEGRKVYLHEIFFSFITQQNPAGSSNGKF